MLKFFISSTLTFIFCLSAYNPGRAIISMENEIGFTTNNNVLRAQEAQMFVGLLDKELKQVNQKLPAGFNFFNDALPLDIYDYWNKRRDENYFVLLTKVVYLIDKDITFFDEEILSNEQIIQEKMPEYHIEKTGSNKFHIDCGFLAPSFDYELNFYRPPFVGKIADVQKKIEKLNPELGRPMFSVVQHNYKYGRVLMHKTSKMSVCIANYYPFANGKTLEVNYTLNYIYELPPGLLGGHRMLIREIKDGIASLILNTRNVFSAVEKAPKKLSH